MIYVLNLNNIDVRFIFHFLWSEQLKIWKIFTRVETPRPVLRKFNQAQGRSQVFKDYVIDVVQKGWISQEYPAEWKRFESRKEELSIIDGCLMWGSCVVIPSQGRERVLEELHQCHPGINRMKTLAHSYVWCPGLDKDIEKKVLHCHACQSNQRSPSKAPLHPWEWPKDPWRRLHIDYAGPFKNRMFLVVIDAHSKWLEVIPTTSTTGQVTVSKLCQIFATHGIPETCVMDNGPAFVSNDFAVFMH